MFNKILNKSLEKIKRNKKNEKDEIIELLKSKIEELIDILEKSNLREFAYILGSKKQIAYRNIIAGIFRGIGIGIGVTIVTAILVILLRHLVTLNIPVIGKYIADIVEIVERSR